MLLVQTISGILADRVANRLVGSKTTGSCYCPALPRRFGRIVTNPSVLQSTGPHMTVQGMQQQSHSTPSPQGHEMHGFVDPLMGFEMVEMTDEEVDEGGMARE